jgi:hypothetical protein
LLTSCPSTWTEAFELLTPHLKANNTTLYFEELQWLANYRQDFVDGEPEDLGKRRASAIVTNKISSERGEEPLLSENGILLDSFMPH